MNNEKIKAIISRKKEGIQPGEKENEYIFQWLADTVILLNSEDIPILNEIQELFPDVYDRWTEHDEKSLTE